MTSRTGRILFASPHCVMDFTSGAAVATMDALQLVAAQGFTCAAFCGSKLDWAGEENFEQLLADQRLAVRSKEVTVATGSVRLLHASKGSVPLTVFRTQNTRIEVWSPGEAEAMLGAFDRFLGDFAPNALLTYGGDPVTLALIHSAKERAIPVIFGLHNFAYHDVRVFQEVDYVVVPSEFSRRYYERLLGLRCEVLPYAIDWGRVRVQRSGVRGQESEDREQKSGDRDQKLEDRDHGSGGLNPEPRTLTPGFVTFVNPQPAKGVFVFARIAEQLARRRPDIPLLVVESRGAAAWLEQTGLDLSWAENLHAMANTHDPRDFYTVTKLLLVPSLWNESFGLVAAEAMINGIPVLASNRGALPEVMGGAEGQRAGVRSQESGVRGQKSEVRKHTRSRQAAVSCWTFPASTRRRRRWCRRRKKSSRG